MYIVADIGGTKTRIARSKDLESFESPIVIDSIVSYEDGIAKIVEIARSLAGNEKIDAIALDITGVISQDGKTPLTAPHLQDWRGKPLGRELESALTTRVHITNDTAQVGLGEAVYGAGKGAKILVYVTVSTGVNGVRIVNQTIDPAAYGFEIGGQYIVLDGAKKSLEELVSGKAIQERYGVHPKVIEKDSPVWEELAELFAIGLHNTILHWSPDRVVLGGSMFNEIGISVERVKVHLAEIMIKFPNVPEVVHSSLGDLGGLWGGLARLKQIA
ncbi:MAG TPA: ROK family protein [Candidatus Paceibacterota bacterium]|nr:ROK family protein [Candidatus Paceibacterota bacterium]